LTLWPITASARFHAVHRVFVDAETVRRRAPPSSTIQAHRQGLAETLRSRSVIGEARSARDNDG
jgi:hypothetical protein